MSVRISALYPDGKDARFDFDFYCEHHLPLVLRLFGEHGCTRVEADRGLPGADGQAPTYIAVGHMEFDSVDGFKAAMAASGKRILADVPKYTNVTPVLQIGEIATSLS